MIELNLTYEESKKILELGYDFASVCTKFEVKTDIEYHVNYGIIIKSDKWNRIEIESNRVIQDNGKLEHGQRIAFNPLSIPIIPKAALEACLPEFTTNKAWFSLVKDSYPETRIHYWIFETPKTIPQSDTWGRSPRLLMRYVKKQMLYENLHSAYFKSAYEAFIWCHENYPEELKEKFEEVMK